MTSSSRSPRAYACTSRPCAASSPAPQIVLQVDEPQPARPCSPAGCPTSSGFGPAAEPRPAGGRGRTRDGARRARRRHGRALLCGRAAAAPPARGRSDRALARHLAAAPARVGGHRGRGGGRHTPPRRRRAHRRQPHRARRTSPPTSSRPGPAPACRSARSPTSSSPPPVVWPPRRPTWREPCSAPRSRPRASSRSAASTDAAPGSGSNRGRARGRPPAGDRPRQARWRGSERGTRRPRRPAEVPVGVAVAHRHGPVGAGGLDDVADHACCS